MKVLMINVVCGIRSTGRICTDLATELEKQGHQVKIAYGRENVPEQYQKYAVRIGSELGVKIHGAKARLFDACGFGSRRDTERFIEWVKEYDPDVIHLHNLHGYYINIEVLFKYLKTCRKRIIWTLHDCWAFTGHSAYCDAIGCEKWVNGCEHCPQIKEYPKSLVDCSKNNWKKKCYFFSSIPNLTIVTPSKWLASFVERSFLRNYPVKVINNGIDISQFKPTESDFREKYGLGKKFVLLGVATTWTAMKGYTDYIELSKKLDNSYQIVLIGLTEDQINKLPGNILGIKRTGSIKELAGIYSAADAMLNLSYCDTYPTVNLEARACGLPIITYETGGSPESAGKNNIVIEKGNVDEIICAISRLKKNSIKVEKAESIETLDNKKTMEKYLGLY